MASLRSAAATHTDTDEHEQLDFLPEPAQEAEPPASEQGGTPEFTAKIKRVIYRDDTTNFGIYIAYCREHGEFSIKATSAVVAQYNDTVKLKGEWVTYKGKPQLRASFFQIRPPQAAAGFGRWLARNIRGIGEQTANKLVKTFGDEIEAALEDVNRLIGAGLKPEIAQSVHAQWLENKHMPRIYAFLTELGFDDGQIRAIVNTYSSSAIIVTKENPWALARTVNGIGFRSADAAALKLGFPKEDPRRVRAGLEHVLGEATERNGHTRIGQKDLIVETAKTLTIDRQIVIAGMPEFVQSDRCFYDSGNFCVAPAHLNRAEENLARYIDELLTTGDRCALSPEGLDAEIDEAIELFRFKRDQSQVDAVKLALTHPFSIITGGPGTGKSTIQKLIVHILDKRGIIPAMTSPTGRAAKRLSETSGLPASTIHRYLVVDPMTNEFVHNENNPTEDAWVICDETSMEDVQLAASHLGALNYEACMTWVGDIDQLPSVGAGQVLRDLIESGKVPVARLSVTHRNEKSSEIPVAAARINRGQHPLHDGKNLRGFEIIEAYSSEDIRKAVINTIEHRVSALGFNPDEDVQVLASMRKGECGVVSFNQELKSLFNPGSDNNSIELNKRLFSIGDRVMHLKNNYKKSVFNGEMGSVVDIGEIYNVEAGKELPSVVVDFDGHAVVYTKADVIEMEHAWASTVHKAQGSEFPVVIFMAPNEHSNMLMRTLFYTAATRAKKHCFVVGDPRAIQRAIDNNRSLGRVTGLQQRLQHLPPALRLGMDVMATESFDPTPSSAARALPDPSYSGAFAF